jgi:hypothetical protein
LALATLRENRRKKSLLDARARELLDLISEPVRVAGERIANVVAVGVRLAERALPRYTAFTHRSRAPASTSFGSSSCGCDDAAVRCRVAPFPDRAAARKGLFMPSDEGRTAARGPPGSVKAEIDEDAIKITRPFRSGDAARQHLIALEKLARGEEP